MLVELRSVEADGLVEGGTLMVVEIHGDVHGQAEEAAPQLSYPVVEKLRLRLEDGGEEVAMPMVGGGAMMSMDGG